MYNSGFVDLTLVFELTNFVFVFDFVFLALFISYSSTAFLVSLLT